MSAYAYDPAHPDTRAARGVKGGLYGAILQAYLRRKAAELGLDPAVVMSVVPHEGGYQGAVGDQGTSFGPFQLHRGGALPGGIGNPRAWANSAAGIDYALAQIKKTLGGRKGAQAVRALITEFERPAQQYVPGEIAKALATYQQLAGQGRTPQAGEAQAADMGPPATVAVGGLPALRGLPPELQQLALSRLSEHGPLARLKAQPQLLETALSTLLPHQEQIQQTLQEAGNTGKLPAALELAAGGGKPGQVEPALLSLAAQYGLKVTSGFRDVAKQAQLYAGRSGPGTVAAPGKSYHNFGRAIDVAPGENLQKLVLYVRAHPGQFREFFFDPLGWYVKNGKIVKGSIGGHSDHAHVAI